MKPVMDSVFSAVGPPMNLTGRLGGIREGMCWMNELIASKLRVLGLNARRAKDCSLRLFHSE
jgi:hypothetical protein